MESLSHPRKQYPFCVPKTCDSDHTPLLTSLSSFYFCDLFCSHPSFLFTILPSLCLIFRVFFNLSSPSINLSLCISEASKPSNPCMFSPHSGKPEDAIMQETLYGHIFIEANGQYLSMFACSYLHVHIPTIWYVVWRVGEKVEDEERKRKKLAGLELLLPCC